MKAVRLGILLVSVGLASGVQAQGLAGVMVQGVVAGAKARGEEILEQAPGALDGFLHRAREGEEFPTPQACLGRLQLGLNVARVLAATMPFSSTWTREDQRGSVGRVRLMLNGERIHAEAWCDGARLMARERDWSFEEPGWEVFSGSSFDAVMGTLLLMNQQGLFEEEAPAASASTAPAPAPVETIPKERIDNALATALGGSKTPATGGVIAAITPCFNTGSLSSDALRARIGVAFDVGDDGRVASSSIRVIEAPTESAAERQLFEALRRAIIRCGAENPALGTRPPATVRMGYADGKLSLSE